MPKNLGHTVLAIFLIYTGVVAFIPALYFAYVGAILAIAAGVLLLLGK